jgi:hypothetical protein
MALNRDKLKNIVGGITTPTPQGAPVRAEPPKASGTWAEPEPPAAGQVGEPADENGAAGEAKNGASRRFAQRGRPKGSKSELAGKTRKVKVSLYLSEAIVNDLYEWAHADRVHPGEMFDRALRQFHEREAKRRNAGTR